MDKTKRLIIIGAGEFAELACEYFEDDSAYRVCGFAVEDHYYKESSYLGLPVVKLKELTDYYSPEEYEIFVAITYVHLNKERERICNLVKKKGYSLASYVSSNSFIGKKVIIGQNVFIFENCSIQHYVCIGEGTVVWSGSVIAHRSEIGGYVWIAPKVTIPGYCKIGSRCFVGCGSAMIDSVEIDKDVVIGAGTVLTKQEVKADCVIVGNPGKELDKIHWDKFCRN